MEPRIEIIEEKKLIGMHVSMSLADNKTYNLFSSFMPRRKEVKNAINRDILDVRVYSNDYHLAFNPSVYFTKWACVEVSNGEQVPEGMEILLLEGGKYAVFTQKGVNKGDSLFQYIFSSWLPTADYVLDDRPHFDVLGEKYQQRARDAEQEFWIPVKERKEANG